LKLELILLQWDLEWGALIDAIYGMNLTNGFEQNPYDFYIITGSSCCFLSGIIAFAIMRLLRYRKIRLHRSTKTNLF